MRSDRYLSIAFVLLGYCSSFPGHGARGRLEFEVSVQEQRNEEQEGTLEDAGPDTEKVGVMGYTYQRLGKGSRPLSTAGARFLHDYGVCFVNPQGTLGWGDQSDEMEIRGQKTTP